MWLSCQINTSQWDVFDREILGCLLGLTGIFFSYWMAFVGGLIWKTWGLLMLHWSGFDILLSKFRIEAKFQSDIYHRFLPGSFGGGTQLFCSRNEYKTIEMLIWWISEGLIAETEMMLETVLNWPVLLTQPWIVPVHFVNFSHILA